MAKLHPAADCFCSLCTPSLGDGRIDLHIACGCSDEHCPARRISDEHFLESFTDDTDLKRVAFSVTMSLVGDYIGLALMAGIAQKVATINADGFVRVLGFLGSQADH